MSFNRQELCCNCNNYYNWMVWTNHQNYQAKVKIDDLEKINKELMDEKNILDEIILQKIRANLLEVSKLESNIKDLKDNNKDLKDDIEYLKDDIKYLKYDNEDLKDEISKLKDKIRKKNIIFDDYTNYNECESRDSKKRKNSNNSELKDVKDNYKIYWLKLDQIRDRDFYKDYTSGKLTFFLIESNSKKRQYDMKIGDPFIVSTYSSNDIIKIGVLYNKSFNKSNVVKFNKSFIESSIDIMDLT